MLWDMDFVWKLLNGPLWYLPNLQIAMRTRFIKRLVQYLKPTREFFCQLEYNVNTFRHAQCACQLFRLLTSCNEGINNQFFKELIGEIFTHLKDQIQYNLKNTQKLMLNHAPFSKESINTTLSRTYLILIGILSESQRGIKFFKTHDMLSFLFPLTRTESKNRDVGPNDYLFRLLAFNLDYTKEKNFRMLFSAWIATGSYYLRKSLISHLELLYRANMPGFDEWSINVLGVLLKDRERETLALTALKVLEKINLSLESKGTKLNSAHKTARSYIIDLVNTSPTDDVVGNYGQFLFIKMLSTKKGFEYLKKKGWIDTKRKEWINHWNKRYTTMLETALLISVNKMDDDNDDNNSSDKSDKKDDKKDDINQFNNDSSNSNGNGYDIKDDLPNDWLPYHLIHEHRTDEEELYNEYLTSFPWVMNITIQKATGQDIDDVKSETFFDYSCYLPKKDNERYPKSLGPGVQCVICDNKGSSKPILIDKNSKIKIRLGIGSGCMDDMYSFKALEKTVSIDDMNKHSKTHSIITEGQCYFFFTNNDGNNNNSNNNYNKHNNSHNYLARIFFSLKDLDNSSRTTHSLVRPLPHFYGELAETKEGCDYIINNNDLDTFVSIIKKYNINNNNNEDNLELRSSLWALGMIGSSNNGLNLLNNYNKLNIIQTICQMTRNSPTLSIRGTCLYILGLLSRTKHGMNKLSSLGFDFPADNLELDLSVAVPKNIDAFFSMGNTEYVKSWPMKDINDIKNGNQIYCKSSPILARPANMKPLDPNELLGKPGHTEETVMAHISALCNNVTQKSSASSLHKLRTKKPSVFTNPILFRECLKIINSYQMKLAARRFILFTLFDNVYLNNIQTCNNVFNHDLNNKILHFKQIREWRYQHKQKILKQKQTQSKHSNNNSNKSSSNNAVNGNSNSNGNINRKSINKVKFNDNNSNNTSPKVGISSQNTRKRSSVQSSRRQSRKDSNNSVNSITSNGTNNIVYSNVGSNNNNNNNKFSKPQPPTNKKRGKSKLKHRWGPNNNDNNNNNKNKNNRHSKNKTIGVDNDFNDSPTSAIIGPNPLANMEPNMD